jgi:hypothetical protein
MVHNADRTKFNAVAESAEAPDEGLSADEAKF